MAWKSIRLELAPSQDHPQGSASRAYLLRVPLDASGLIDADGLGCEPASATARRFWPNEPDTRGLVIATKAGWAIQHEPAQDGAGPLLLLENRPLLSGEQVTLTRSDGCSMQFRIASVSELS